MFFNITYHAFLRAKERLNDKIIPNYKKLDFYEMELQLNRIISTSNNSIDRFQAKNKTTWFKIQNFNLYIITKNNIILTIKNSTIENLIANY